MVSMKKLSGFRQLSLNCDSPQTPPRRPPLRKQFSEDINDYKAWPEHDLSIKISLNNRNLRNPFIKNAWIENALEISKEDPVIIKKCSENRRIPPNNLVKQTSLDKETLKSRQELADRLKQTLKTQEQKPNIRIFLAQHPKEPEKQEDLNEPPKLIPSLTTGIVDNDKSSFKLRKNAKQKMIFNTSQDNWQVPNKKPVVDQDNESVLTNEKISCNEVKPIDSVIIRPATAASKREMFQKRTNSAFNTTVNLKDTTKPRKPLIRSSSAPCKPERIKTKMLSKHSKHKSLKKVQTKSPKNEEVDKVTEDNPKSQKELNRTAAVQGNDVVTMVSLISPSGSECEEEEDDIEEDKMKSKNEYINTDKTKEKLEEQKPPPKMMSLRKAVKTVSFQQSSIHAIRSFSASFPARRASVTAAMMLNNHLNNSTKVQEKRSTNTSTPDDDERVPKRRLVRCNTGDTKTNSFEQEEKLDEHETSGGQSNVTSNFGVEIKAKKFTENQIKDTNKQSTMEEQGDKLQSEANEENKDNDAKKEANSNPALKSHKEKQCWSMYCKMSEKGVNISFDTILRGMLTPTEYRISKKHLLANSATGTSEDPK
ncbi:uncharacterized protein LOC130894584 [Diorhabda carinulata]|uniref:uncharacterized protein LOC130894584 n=1 Tax=Diorhabda carinulata TaxID=1163345 RepID=UPI0025A0F8E3|nr:uncharacterized protein LOC130894584 [Diorhabda carinulata]XP_057657473.1 uncharacterized protein LOC130894584 [Diorhabda carinulata]XP_057657474.1 uncharacterized protein LOC130894584 [Diorhabda carinulata]XP_057657475.1 uncharacterized protein LOC130894584 [Diorhabda carinulata]